jgi:Ca-activated chloride channel family protein
LEGFRFAEPVWLWLLVLPAALLVLLAWRVIRRRAEVHRLRTRRIVPVRERYAATGDLVFWFSALVAASLCVVALARPQARVSLLQTARTDIVILQDGSASMYVNDVRPDRWRRSIQFLRTLAESLSWQGDRVALALFAQLAAPQVRLTTDPNALFFFLDHLGERSPFPLESVPTWDTNIEEGIRWGLRLVEQDEQLFGPSGNPKAFVVISDGQAWSGTVATALQAARQRGVPVYVIGVGTTAGGMIPEPARSDGTRPPPVIRSTLDRPSLARIAAAGGGEYFEIGREPDRVVVYRLIDRLARLSNVAQPVETFDDLYRRALMAAAIVLCFATLALRKRTELAWHAAGALATAVLLALII